MDTLTHIALGACVGDALLGKKIGKRAMLVGAMANSIPDIDFISSFWLPIDENLLAHRGFTHSILFCIITAFFMALLFKRWFHPKTILLKKWILFFSIELFLHLFIDAFNAYGVGWFEPFSHYRISFNTIFVVDPFFSAWLGIATIALIILKKKNKKRKLWRAFGLGLSSVYLLYCVVNKFKIDAEVKDTLAQQKIAYKDFFTTPTPLNNWLWYIVVKNDTGFYIGYQSLFDSQKKIDFHFFPSNDSLLETIHDHKEVQNLIRFSKKWYTVNRYRDTIMFNDLVFGQVAGWENPTAPFVFRYILNHPENNNLIIQRGRFEMWNGHTIQTLIRRIRGN